MLRVPLLNPQPRAKSQPTAYRGLSKLRRVGRSLSEGATKSCTVASPLQPLDVSLEEHLDIKNNGQMDGLNRDADNDSLFSRSVTIQKLREDSSRLWSARVLLSDQQDNGYVTRDRAVKVHRGSEDETEDEVYYWLDNLYGLDSDHDEDENRFLNSCTHDNSHFVSAMEE